MKFILLIFIYSFFCSVSLSFGNVYFRGGLNGWALSSDLDSETLGSVSFRKITFQAPSTLDADDNE